MTAAAPLPRPDTFTAADLGHPARFPLLVGDVWRWVCNCHWWVALDPDEAEAVRR